MSKTLGVICDLDGLLVDSEQIHFEAYRIVLADYGVEITREMFVAAWLSGTRYGTHYYLQEVGVTDEAEIHRARMRKAELFIQLAPGRLHLMPGAHTFLERVKAAGYACGVGTGSYEEEYRFVAETCGLDAYVQVVVGGSDVAHNKPAPDIFLKVAERLGVSPECSVVFENSDLGVSAALNAGMKCVAVPSSFTQEQNFSKATVQLERLDQVDFEKLLKWIE